MIPILIDTDNTILGNLNDCTGCNSTEERNGIYEAQFEIPMQSDIYDKIQIGCFISAKPNDISDNQKFRIYKRINNKIAKTTTFYCEHIRYKLAGVPVAPDTYSGTPSSILSDMLTSVYANTAEFTAWSDISAVKEIKMNVPSTAGAMLAGKSGSLLDTFGGEYEFDNYTVKLHQNRGQDRKTEIRYRKNLTGFICTEDATNTYTHVYPFYRNEENDVYVELSQKVIELANAPNLPFQNCYMLDLSSELDTTPTQSQLMAKANAFIQANDLDTISRNYKVSFIPLWQTEEYKNLAVLERCSLCDTVSIIHEDEIVRAKIIKTVYDVLNERYISLELGNAKSNFAQTVAQQVKHIDDSINNTKSFLQQSIERQTKRITGNLGGYIVLRDGDEDGLPDEQLIMDNLTVGAARKMWRWNLGGLGYSRNGYAGPFEIALTDLGEINASMITTGSLDASIITTGVLNADLIRAGVIRDLQNKNYWNLATGEFHLSSDVAGDVLDDLTQQQVFNILTNNSANQGIYLSNGYLMLNASYIQTGNLSADRITTGNMSANRITSGTLDASQVNVTNLNASNITSGTIDASQISVINLDADAITSGEISANRITSGILQSTNGNTFFNLNNGTIGFNLPNGTKMRLAAATGLRILDSNDNEIAALTAALYNNNPYSQIITDFGEFEVLRIHSTDNARVSIVNIANDNSLFAVNGISSDSIYIKSDQTSGNVGSFVKNAQLKSVLTADIANVATGNFTEMSASEIKVSGVQTFKADNTGVYFRGQSLDWINVTDINGNTAHVLGYR